MPEQTFTPNQANPIEQTLTPEQTLQQAIVYSQVAAMRDAAVLLRGLTPDDALAIAVYTLYGVAGYQFPEGDQPSPMTEALMASAAFAIEALEGTRYHRPAEGDNPLARRDEVGQMLDSEASDDGSWAESMMDNVLTYGLMVPDSTMVMVEVMLHYLARGPELRVDVFDENRIQLKTPVPSSEDVRGFANAILANFRAAMQTLSAPEGATS